ncbi:TVP38/TMEM64 family protein [Heyndrickxia vini]|uniref:TVP38/TMEM64 family protein n=1 Tax=Heyndrickxia vini TaxID=1476025 RepID=A0ABX7E759_9BACI|nr:VTT domain-containing protein [Heyndrickxia vini]QQZ10647.1 TVP38/TMEM64 family protein [Heyndrickxia vini]
MNEQLLMLFSFVEGSAVLAPFMFILFHVLRQFLFIPVAVVCMAGGILFGSLLGIIYSLVGLLLLSVLFYWCIKKMPKTYEKLLKIKLKCFGQYAKLTIGQIAILRLIPFFHYHLLNICLLERNPTFKSYLKGSFITNIPLVVFYTVFGQFISQFTPSMIIIILIALSILFFILREKVIVMKWKEFFPGT